MVSKIFSRIFNYLNNLNVRQVLILAAVAAALMFATIFIVVTKFAPEPEKIIEQKNEIVQPHLTEIVVAKMDIAPRVIIRESMLQLKEVPENSVPNGAFTSINEIVNRSAKITILAGDPITPRKLYSESEPAGFVGAIPPDCRAVSINVNNITGVAGFAKPGDYVDVLLAENNEMGATTSIILQNVLLLSVNQSMDRNEIEKDDNGEKNPNAAINNPSIATLALRPHEVLKLVSASKLGEIYLMLRPSKPLDMYVDSIDYTVLSSKAPKKEETVAPAPAPAPAPVVEKPVEETPVDTTPKIEIIYGDEIVQSPDDDKNKKSPNKE